MDVQIALNKDEVAAMDRSVKYNIGATSRGLSNVRQQIANAKACGRRPDPVAVEREAFLTEELDRLHGLQARLRALDVDG